MQVLDCLPVLLSDVLLAASLVLQVKYQRKEGTSAAAGSFFNMVLGFAGTCMFL